MRRGGYSPLPRGEGIAALRGEEIMQIKANQNLEHKNWEHPSNTGQKPIKSYSSTDDWVLCIGISKTRHTACNLNIISELMASNPSIILHISDL
uniref:Uncharacterized protein n=1 Tax=Pyxicephalus adspersus TaxID=30357 RepID=A0AAV3A0Y6_PYXAD|nr:TPA: hypothetical protein GDO54_015378 [Pyxicephalus adspersus]